MTRDTATPSTIEHRIGPTGRFSVKVADWDLELVSGPDDVVRVRSGDDQPLPDDLEIERGTESLAIRQPSRFSGAGFVRGARSGGRRLAIEVPARSAVIVETASGDVVANGLRGDQHLRTASGALRVEAAAGDLATETVSGDIAVGVEGSIGLAAKTVSGDVSVEGGRVERVRLTTTSGDVRLTSELGPGPHAIVTVSGDAILLSDRGLRITAETVAGDLQTDLPHTSEGGPGRRSLVVGDGATELQFRSVSGDLRVLDPFAAGNRNGPAAPSAMTPRPISADSSDAAEATRLDILRALESGQIDIAEATDRLARLDGASDD